MKPIEPGLPASYPWIKQFSDLGIRDAPIVGEKIALLGELKRALPSSEVLIPDGFALTTAVCRHFLSAAGLDREISAILRDHPSDDHQSQVKRVQAEIAATAWPSDLESVLEQAYRNLQGEGVEPPEVAVRSSLTAPELVHLDFPQRPKSYLRVKGFSAVAEACRRCFADFVGGPAIPLGFAKDPVAFHPALAVGVQRMVRSDLACSGIIVASGGEEGNRESLLIRACYGLGLSLETRLTGADDYFVRRAAKGGAVAVEGKTCAVKVVKVVCDGPGDAGVRRVPVPPLDRERFVLEDEEILTLARATCLIEDYFFLLNGCPVPSEIEWAKDGLTGELFIVQARPLKRESALTQSGFEF